MSIAIASCRLFCAHSNCCKIVVKLCASCTFPCSLSTPPRTSADSQATWHSINLFCEFCILTSYTSDGVCVSQCWTVSSTCIWLVLWKGLHLFLQVHTFLQGLGRKEFGMCNRTVPSSLCLLTIVHAWELVMPEWVVCFATPWLFSRICLPFGSTGLRSYLVFAIQPSLFLGPGIHIVLPGSQCCWTKNEVQEGHSPRKVVWCLHKVQGACIPILLFMPHWRLQGTSLACSLTLFLQMGRHVFRNDELIGLEKMAGQCSSNLACTTKICAQSSKA